MRLAGLAGVFGGAFSMATGEYVSRSAQRETLELELDIEREELAERPASERQALERIYLNRGGRSGRRDACRRRADGRPRDRTREVGLVRVLVDLAGARGAGSRSVYEYLVTDEMKAYEPFR